MAMEPPQWQRAFLQRHQLPDSYLVMHNNGSSRWPRL